MGRIDVTPADLLGVAARLTGTADALALRAGGIGYALATLAPQLGADLGASAQAVAASAQEATAHVIAAYRGLAAVLSDSAGRYVAVDSGGDCRPPTTRTVAPP